MRALGFIDMHEIRCSEIWGGIENADLDVCTSGVTASLFSSAADGGKGGDIYYFSVCGSDKLTRIALADVQGHGAAVTSLSGTLFHALEANMNRLEGHDVLVAMNHEASRLGYRGLTTAAVVAFYISDSNLYYAYAGHPPALVRRKATGLWTPAVLKDREEVANLPLGVDDNVAFDQAHTRLAHGDRLFLYTDGVIEAMNAAEEQFGEERLRTLLDANGGASLADIKSAVIDGLRSHTGGPLTHDDVTLMAVEVR